MRTIDLLAMSVGILFQQRLRTVLTLLGVVVGACLLVVTMSIGQGVDQWLVDLADIGDQMRRIRVSPGVTAQTTEQPPPEILQVEGDMSADRRQRIREERIRQWKSRQQPTPVLLDGEQLRGLRELPHVQRLVVADEQLFQLVIAGQRREARASSSELGNRPDRERLVLGDYFSAPDADEVLLHEALVYDLGYHDDASLETLVGTQVEVEYAPWRRLLEQLAPKQSDSGQSDTEPSTPEPSTPEPSTPEPSTPEPSTPEPSTTGGGQETGAGPLHRRLPEALRRLNLGELDASVWQELLAGDGQPQVVRRSLRVVGIFRDPDAGEGPQGRFGRLFAPERKTDLLLPHGTFERLLLSLPDRQQRGVTSAILIVDDLAHVEGVVDEIERRRLSEFSLRELLTRIRTNLALVTTAISVLGGLSLLVAGLGITNTMVMSVLERTREIGIMKALGARSGTIGWLFLLQGGLIGGLAGILGVGLGWLLSLPAEYWFRLQLAGRGLPHAETFQLFLFPTWLVVGSPLFTAGVTMLATLYPARRAARIDPIQALRHE